ncbi:MAG: redoxin domain-containing protein [Vicinamibacterales bacterium]
MATSFPRRNICAARSADWCPDCKTPLMDLQSWLGELRAKGLEVAAIRYDPVPTLAELATRRQIAFPLLSDAGSATIRAFGIQNPMPEMALISLEGSCDYQACDDKVCFNPVSVPLTWTMSLKALFTPLARRRRTLSGTPWPR